MFERCILALRSEDEADRLPVMVANLGLMQLTRDAPGDLTPPRVSRTPTWRKSSPAWAGNRKRATRSNWRSA